MSEVPEEVIGISEIFSKLVGKVLTNIEAAIPDKTQRESLKKIIEQHIYDSRSSVFDYMIEKFNIKIGKE